MTTTINLTDERLFTAVWGSGASYSYGWYVKTHLDEDAQTWQVVLESGNGGVESATLTPASIRRTIATIQAERPDFTSAVTRLDWSDPDVDSDVDADVADVIVQYAVLGEVIFG